MSAGSCGRPHFIARRATPSGTKLARLRDVAQSNPNKSLNVFRRLSPYNCCQRTSATRPAMDPRLGRGEAASCVVSERGGRTNGAGNIYWGTMLTLTYCGQGCASLLRQNSNYRHFRHGEEPERGPRFAGADRSKDRYIVVIV